jgi:DNA-directed RNA polymerase specialized sigma24 family protein
MICADFLAGANLDNPDLLLHSISRCFGFLPSEQRQAFVAHALENAS